MCFSPSPQRKRRQPKIHSHRRRVEAAPPNDENASPPKQQGQRQQKPPQKARSGDLGCNPLKMRNTHVPNAGGKQAEGLPAVLGC